MSGASGYLMLLVVVEGRYAVPCTAVGGRVVGASDMSTSYHPNPRIVSVSFGITGDKLLYEDGVDVVDVRGLNNDVASVGTGLKVTQIFGMLPKVA